MNFTLFISLINKLFVEIKWLKKFTRCRNIKKKNSIKLYFDDTRKSNQLT